MNYKLSHLISRITPTYLHLVFQVAMQPGYNIFNCTEAVSNIGQPLPVSQQTQSTTPASVEWDKRLVSLSTCCVQGFLASWTQLMQHTARFQGWELVILIHSLKRTTNEDDR